VGRKACIAAIITVLGLAASGCARGPGQESALAPTIALLATRPLATVTPTSPAAAQPMATVAAGATTAAVAPALSPATGSTPSQGVAGPSPAATRAPAAGNPTSPAAGGAQGLAEAIGQVSIARIGLQTPIVAVSWHLAEVDGLVVAEWDVAQNAAGHHRGSAPLGGPGNCVLSGHSRPSAGGVFQRLHELRRGDRIVVTDSLGQAHTYAVDEVVQVAELGASLDQRRENARYMAPTDDTRLTLITCWPDWAYTHRLIVIARPA